MISWGFDTAQSAQHSPSCTDAKVDTQNLPDNRSQADLNWCHSYALADLYSFYAKKKVSAFGIAAQSYQAMVLNSGSARPDITSWKSEPLFNFAHIAHNSNKLCLEENFSTTDKSAESFSSVFAKLEKTRPDQNSRRCVEGYNDLVSNIDEAVLALLNKLSGGSFITAVINSKCLLKVDIPKGTATQWDFQTQSSLKCAYPLEIDEKNPDSINCSRTRLKKSEHLPWKTMNKKLSSSEPSLIFYDASFLLKSPADPSADYKHHSTLIGRRFNKKTEQCEYLLRNTWGTDCSQYPDRFECQEGNLWIPQNELMKHAKGFMTFDSAEDSQDNRGN